jgi:hypothetical protein
LRRDSVADDTGSQVGEATLGSMTVRALAHSERPFSKNPSLRRTHLLVLALLLGGAALTGCKSKDIDVPATVSDESDATPEGMDDGGALVGHPRR